MGYGPIHDLLKFLPVIYILEINESQWRTGYDQTIVTVFPDLVKGFVEGLQMLNGRTFGSMVPCNTLKTRLQKQIL